MSQYYKLKEWRKTLKIKLVEGFGGKCNCCGLIDHPCVYDFHHVDPNNKSFKLSTSKIVCWKKFVEEAKKCIMVCSHCHRKLHMNLIPFPEIPHLFEESKVMSFKENYQTVEKRKRMVSVEGFEPPT